MKLGVLKETAAGERRVAVVPETVKRMVAKKIDVVIEAGAGEGSYIKDDDYKAAGATIEATSDAVLAIADVVLTIGVPSTDFIGRLREGTALVSLLYPLVNTPLVKALNDRKITAISVDSIPRTTLAQMMDVLSSQATITGYYAVLLAAQGLPKFFPMLMTAAGTIAPAKVLILGAGVAGLQAIGTARRLGAVVEAFDVRKVVKEQVESLGAKFVDVPSDEDAQTASGYAKEVSDEYKKRQAEVLKKHVAKSDVVITTALIPGRKAPILVTEDMVKEMKWGSVIVDLAAEQGGNCEVTVPGERVIKDGVTVIGKLHLTSEMAVHASQMYSRNMEKFLFHLSADGKLKINLDEEITKGSVITHEGTIVHTKVAELLATQGVSNAQ